MSHSQPDNRGWIGVDLDGTLAEYTEWKGIEHIGAPIPAMVTRVLDWCNAGREVRIFTARVFHGEGRSKVEAIRAKWFIQDWCLEHLGRTLEVTCTKDFRMTELWDDRAVQVVPNTGARADGQS